MGIRQIRVFMQSSEPNEDGAETLIGKVFRPLALEFADSLDWFSRYGSPADDSGDCDITLIPDEYKRPLQPGGNGFHRSLRFRYSIADDRQASFERRAQEIINRERYCVSDFRLYDYVADVGNNRFLGNENRQPGRSETRAMLVIQLYSAISRLVIDSLVPTTRVATA